MLLDKPVIAAVEGHAVAGGLELALWCDLRVAAADATFGVYCRRWGVPLVDGGTVRLPRLIGHSHALDLILTGRGVTRGRGAATWAWPTGWSSRAGAARRGRSLWPTSWPPSRSAACATTGARPMSSGAAISTPRSARETELGLATLASGEARTARPASPSGPADTGPST